MGDGKVVTLRPPPPSGQIDDLVAIGPRQDLDCDGQAYGAYVAIRAGGQSLILVTTVSDIDEDVSALARTVNGRGAQPHPITTSHVPDMAGADWHVVTDASPDQPRVARTSRDADIIPFGPKARRQKDASHGQD